MMLHCASSKAAVQGFYFCMNRHINYGFALFTDSMLLLSFWVVFFSNSWKTPQMCLLWAELQAAQLSGGAQGAMSQLPPVHGAAEQHVHRLVTQI